MCMCAYIYIYMTYNMCITIGSDGVPRDERERRPERESVRARGVQLVYLCVYMY